MKLIESYVTNNPCYKANGKINVKGLMLHSVGVGQPSAPVFVGIFNRASYNAACVHAFIDANDGTVYQTLPWSHKAWHCGGSGNSTHIGVEMCEPGCIQYVGGASFICHDIEKAKTMVKRTYDAAVELFAFLCKQFGLDPQADGVIISHKEGHSRGIASNHSDPEHLWKQLSMGYTMDGFRLAVKNAMNGTTAQETADKAEKIYRVRKTWDDAKSQIGAFLNLDNAKKAADGNAGYYVFDSSGEKIYPSESVRPSSDDLKKGDKVKVLKAVTYTGGSFRVYHAEYDVIEVRGDRVVIGKGHVITAAVNKANLQKI